GMSSPMIELTGMVRSEATATTAGVTRLASSEKLAGAIWPGTVRLTTGAATSLVARAGGAALRAVVASSTAARAAMPTCRRRIGGRRDVARWDGVFISGLLP